jgi:hypothetical protein
MAWLPLDRAPPAGPCILVADGRPAVGTPLHPRILGRPEGWFLPVAALAGRWRQHPEMPAGEGWLVIDRLRPDEDGASFGVCTAAWFRRFPGTEVRWAHLPPWPVSAHERLQALEALA